MHWCGWGDPHRRLRLEGKPHLWPFLVRVLGFTQDPELISAPPVPLEEIALPPLRHQEAFLTAIQSAFKPDQITWTHRERILHAYGKSFRDLWRMRRGIVERAPDCICYPESEEDVACIIQLAHTHNVVVIPFGGGSNIAGCLEAIDSQGRMVVSLDMQRMNAILHIDPSSRLARIQSGILGPELEAALKEKQLTLGHFPDSFEHSTLGGWVATRSAGMQSDKYGKIEDMVLALRMVTPQGKIITRTVPKSSNGIDLRHLCIGSEGILGVITEVTVQIHPLPEKKQYEAYLFPDFDLGMQAIYECVQKGLSPSMTRLNDAVKTALSFAFGSQKSRFEQILQGAMKWYLQRIRKMDPSKLCLLLVCFEGTKQQVKSQKRAVEAIYDKYKAVSLGQKPGLQFAKGKYDFPYVRDFVMDRGAIGDVSETSTPWSNLSFLYRKTYEAILKAMPPSRSICGCHISHTYPTGASLYFTFACMPAPGEGLSQYLAIKKAAEDAFLKYGGTLSHHHAVGYEHMPWIEEEISSSGLTALKALKQGLDPQNIMNPGKMIPTEEAIELWHALSE